MEGRKSDDMIARLVVVLVLVLVLEMVVEGGGTVVSDRNPASKQTYSLDPNNNEPYPQRTAPSTLAGASNMSDNANSAVLRTCSLSPSPNTAVVHYSLHPRPPCTARVLGIPSLYQRKWEESNRFGQDTKKPLPRHWCSFIDSRVKEWSAVTATGTLLRSARSIHSCHPR
jgi:hypothetical protein